MRWTCCPALALLLTPLLPATAGESKALPEAVVTAWKDAGGKVGWMQPNEYGVQSFYPKSSGKAGELPGLLLFKVKPGLLAGLPDPAVPFGLRLSHSDTTDAGL